MGRESLSVYPAFDTNDVREEACLRKNIRGHVCIWRRYQVRIYSQFHINQNPGMLSICIGIRAIHSNSHYKRTADQPPQTQGSAAPSCWEQFVAMKVAIITAFGY